MKEEKYGFRKDFDWNNRFDLKTRVGNYEISTVDLGIDHSFGLGRPLYYETMIFKIENEKVDYAELCNRYTTEKEARKGHKKAIKFVKEILLKHH